MEREGWMAKEIAVKSEERGKKTGEESAGESDQRAREKWKDGGGREVSRDVIREQ
jgi:hypothetical protein